MPSIIQRSRNSDSTSSGNDSVAPLSPGAVAGIVIGILLFLSVACIIVFFVVRNKRMAQKEEDDENQKKLVEEFVAVSRNASRTASVAGSRPVSRAGSLDEEREVEMQEQKRKSTYLEVADRSLAPPRPRSRLSSTVSDGSDGSDGSDSSDEHESSSATPHRIV